MAKIDEQNLDKSMELFMSLIYSPVNWQFSLVAVFGVGRFVCPLSYVKKPGTKNGEDLGENFWSGIFWDPGIQQKWLVSM